MKAVLISIQPKWCELIASGKKTIEVRKTKPKLETPFKVYIYCTYGQGLIENNDICYPNLLLDIKVSKKAIWGNCCNGKVIGEFVCDRITEYECSTEGFSGLATTCGTCLTYDEIINCCGGYDLYGWHISDLVIYDKPKELSEFSRHDDTYDNAFGWAFEDRAKSTPIKRPPQSWCYVERSDNNDS